MKGIAAAAGAAAVVGRAPFAPAEPATTQPASQPAELKVKREWEQFGGRRLDVEVAGRSGFILQPRQAGGDKPMEWVWFAPQFAQYPSRRHAWIAERVLAAGMALAGVEVGESCGNVEGRETFTRFHAAVTARFHLARKAVLLPQSRGGLMHYNWAAEHPELVARIAGIYTVCDIRSYPGLRNAAPAYRMTAAELEKHLPQCNPIERLAPLAKAKAPILHIHGDADKIVPLEANSGELIKRYKAMGGSGELLVVPGKGHAEVDEFFQSQPFVDFLIRGKTPVTAPTSRSTAKRGT
jgi:pimeloyl-ACP methyl ester carboxylesterase